MSIVSMLIILWLQASNLAIGIALKAPNTILYFGANTLMVAFTTYLIYKYRNGN